MNIFRPKKKVNPSTESTSNASALTNPATNSTTSSSTMATNIKNITPLNPTPTAAKSTTLISDSSTKLYPLNNSTQNSHAHSVLNNSSLNKTSLPSINTPNNFKHSNTETSRAGLSLNTGANFSFSSLRGGKDIKNKLNDYKAILDNENSQLKFGLETPHTQSSPGITRPSVLTPINMCFQDQPSSPIPGKPARPRRDNLKPFEFGNGFPSESPSSVRPHKLDLINTDKVHFDLNDKYSSHSSSETPLSLNIPSSRSTSASSVSHTSSTNSLANRLEAASVDKFREIKTNAGYLLINDRRIMTTMDELTSVCELGSGTCGHVYKMKHKPTGYEMAVKQMCISGIAEENKRIIMDLDVVAKSHNCKYIVKCLGYFISESDVWICMELMSMCFDKLLKLNNGPIPEHILGKLTVSILQALHYLKEKHSIIHRDIKPSNILIDENGDIKLCDFGISGNLINSKALSRNNTGCAGYMAPERIDPDPQNPVYDIRADVWSLGITLVELATGEYPYKNCRSDFEVMSTILSSDAPELKGDQFSDMFKSFISLCLNKDVSKRPKYNLLLQHEFIKHYSEIDIDVKSWLKSVMDKKNRPKLSDSNLIENFNENVTSQSQNEISKDQS